MPGTVGGLEYAREKYGTLPRADLIDPAIALAENGFALDAGDVFPLALASEQLRKYPTSAAIFLNDGKPYAIGDRLVQKDLAAHAAGDPREGRGRLLRRRGRRGDRLGDPAGRRHRHRRRISTASNRAS